MDSWRHCDSEFYRRGSNPDCRVGRQNDLLAMTVYIYPGPNLPYPSIIPHIIGFVKRFCPTDVAVKKDPKPGGLKVCKLRHPAHLKTNFLTSK